MSKPLLKCSYWRKYKARYYPKCNNGDPCQYCLIKWRNRDLTDYRRRNVDTRVLQPPRINYDLTHWVEGLTEGRFEQNDQIDEDIFLLDEM